MEAGTQQVLSPWLRASLETDCKAGLWEGGSCWELEWPPPLVLTELEVHPSHICQRHQKQGNILHERAQGSWTDGPLSEGGAPEAGSLEMRGPSSPHPAIDCWVSSSTFIVL